MTEKDWVALLAVLQQAQADVKANWPLPPAPEMTMADAAAALNAAQPVVVKLDAWVKTYPGAIRAALRVLKALGGMGFVWASELSSVIGSVPGGLDAAEKYIPEAITALTLFQPAPTWQPGPRVER